MTKYRIAVIVAACLMLTISTSTGLATDKIGIVSPLRSDLWRMEYQQEDSDDVEKPRQSDKDVPDGPNAAVVEPSPQDEFGPLSNGDDSILITPGRTNLNQFSQETPLAEWQVDAAADGEKASQTVTSDWKLSRVVGFRTQKTLAPAKGPSAITFAVAIVAAIVVTGAMFSGRD